jgi:soluble lytic murein transglycosylase-like protein
MSYSSALMRIEQLEARLGFSSSAPVEVTPSGFDTALVSAKSRFDMGSPRVDNPTESLDQDYISDMSSLRSRSTSSRGLTPQLNATFERIAAKHGVPVALVKAVARAESGFNPNATSPAGAQGMMQLMPATGRGLGVTNPFDAEQSIEGGARYLHNALKMFDGDVKLALAAYNAGPNAVKRYDGVPPYAETRTYVDRVLSYAREFGLSATQVPTSTH